MKTIQTLIILAFFLPIKILSGQSTVDSLKQVLESEEDIDKRLSTIQNLIQELNGINWEEAFVYTRQGVAEANQAKHKTYIPEFNEMLGRKFANSGILDSAKILFNKAIEGYADINNQRGIATTSFKLAWVARNESDLELAMKNDLKALRIMEALEDAKGMASAYSRIADNLEVQKKPKESLEYALKGIDLGKDKDVGEEIVFCYLSAGSAYLKLQKFEKALDFYTKAYNQATDFGMKGHLFYIANSQGNALKYLKRYDEAIDKYNELLDWVEKLGISGDYRSTGIANISHVYILKEEYEKALPYQLETLKIQEELDGSRNLQEAYLNTSQIYENLGDYEKAFLFRNKYHAMADSVLSLEKENAINELKIQYETDKKEQKIDVQDSIIAQQQRVQSLSYGIGGLLLILLGGLLYTYRNNKKRNQQLGYLNNSLSNKNKLLDQRNEQNELLVKEIHHRVKNNLEIISGLLELQSARLTDDQSKTALLSSQARVQSMGIIHQKLYQGTDLKRIEMRSYFKNLTESLLDTFDATEEIDVDITMQPLHLDIDIAIPIGLIANELITNSLKYAFPERNTLQKGHISIALERSVDNVLELKYFDDGIGKPIQKTAKGTGFGSQLIELLTRQLNGNIQEHHINGMNYTFDFRL